MKIKKPSSFGLGSDMGQSESTVRNSGDPDMLAVKNPPAKAPGTHMNKAPSQVKGKYENLGAGITRHIHGS
jgi:hypothetical protein